MMPCLPAVATRFSTLDLPPQPGAPARGGHPHLRNEGPFQLASACPSSAQRIVLMAVEPPDCGAVRDVGLPDFRRTESIAGPPSVSVPSLLEISSFAAFQRLELRDGNLGLRLLGKTATGWADWPSIRIRR